MRRSATLLLAALLALGGSPAPASDAAHGHGQHGGQAHGADGHAADLPASTRAYMAAGDRMHRDMAIEYSGDADVDFLRGMIPHHQGAIDMAKVVLEHGKNARVRKLAEEIIRAQEQEIADMRKWLAEMGR